MASWTKQASNGVHLLKTLVRTWVLLPPELVPKDFAHIKDPVAPLDKALYSHPESGFHWDARFREGMQLKGPQVPLQTCVTCGNVRTDSIDNQPPHKARETSSVG